MEDTYKQLAERNGWNYSLVGNRPYFMKNGKYAVPDDTTSEEDKMLLAQIICEGSIEMAQLIILCWNNGITISGPCSGIKEFHQNQQIVLHFSFTASKELIEPLYQHLKEILPTFNHMCRQQEDSIRYDINYSLNGKELSKKESDQIFRTIRNQLSYELENSVIKTR